MRALLLVGLAAAALVACGGAEPPSPIPAAVRTTRAVGTAHAWARHVLVYPDQEPETMATSRGVLDFRTGRGAATLSAPFVGTLLEAGAGKAPTAFEVVYTPTAAYFRTPKSDTRRRWTKVALERQTDRSVLPENPAGGLEFLSGESRRVDEIGRDVVRGAATTRYRVELEAASVAARSSDAVRRAVEEDGRRAFPVDVWIDRAGLIRRLRWDQRFRAGDTSARIVVTTEYFAFGAAVAIDVPPPDQVAD